MNRYYKIIKFDNRKKLLIREKSDIQIRFNYYKQMLKNALYILNININLLFIKILNYRDFIVNFDKNIINIINKYNNNVITRDYIKNDFYKLTKYFFDKIFML